MLLLSFTLRRLRRHWRLNLAVLLGLTLAVALLASLPTYAAAIAARGLKQSLQDAPPAGRSLLVVNRANQASAGLYGMIQDALGELLQGRVQVRERYVAFESLLVSAPDDDGALRTQAVTPPRGPHRGRSADHMVWLWTLDQLANSVRLVEGRLPRTASQEESGVGLGPPPIEAVIGAQTAAKTGLGTGARLRVRYNVGLELRVVGVVEPLAPGDDMWWGDLRMFGVRLNPVADPTTVDPNEEQLTLPLLIAPGSMTQFIPYHQVHWRVLVDKDRITVNNARSVESSLIRLKTSLNRTHTQLTTQLIEILADYRGQFARARIAVFLLTAQALIFVLYTLAMLASFALDRSQGELATLSGRGATALQITLVLALQNLFLAALAGLLLGPLLAHCALALWSRFSGDVVLQQLPRDAYLLALAAAVFGWLALVLPTYPAARRSLLDWQRTRTRPASQARWQRLRLDFFLLALGGLAYWQLRQAGSFVFRGARLADPLLLLGPSLLLVAVALLSLRLFPPLLRGVTWFFQHTRGLLFPMGLARLARDPVKPSRMIILVSLTAGLALFTSTFGDSLAHGQQEMAHYLSGADLRVALDQGPAGRLARLPGVLVVSRVFRATAQAEDGDPVQLLAVDPPTFHRVARYPPGLTNLVMPSLFGVLKRPVDDDQALPAIFSAGALPIKYTFGDEIPLNLGGNRVSLEVLGNISNFPTLSGAFIVVSLPDLAARVDLRAYSVRATGLYEAWLEVDAAQHAALVDRPDLEGLILDDAQARLRALRVDALSQGTHGAFQLNTLTLALLSVAGFLLVQYFAAQGRSAEFSVLRAMGLSTRQLLALLSAESVLVIGLGLLAGTLIGYGLSQIMVTYLSHALSESLGGVLVPRALVDWPSVGQLYAALVVFYALAVVLLLVALMRVGVHRALRMGEE